jgi:hypothetical protein
MDDARLDSYFQQIAAPVMYDKVPVWKASLSLTGPSAEATQSRVARPLTRIEKLKRVIEFLQKQKQLVVVRTQSDRRDAPRNSFLLETFTAVKVRLPVSTQLSGAADSSMTMWLADPLEREDVDTRQTCTLCLMQGFSKPDDAEFPCESMFSVLDVLLLDSGAETPDDVRRHGLMALAGDEAHIEFGRHPETVLARLGAKVSRPRVVTALYRERFIGHEWNLDDEPAEGRYSSHAILYGYAIAIAAGHASLA